MNKQPTYMESIFFTTPSPMNKEKWLLVTFELVEFEKQPVEVQDYMII